MIPLPVKNNSVQEKHKQNGDFVNDFHGRSNDV